MTSAVIRVFLSIALSEAHFCTQHTSHCGIRHVATCCAQDWGLGHAPHCRWSLPWRARYRWIWPPFYATPHCALRGAKNALTERNNKIYCRPAPPRALRRLVSANTPPNGINLNQAAKPDFAPNPNDRGRAVCQIPTTGAHVCVKSQRDGAQVCVKPQQHLTIFAQLGQNGSFVLQETTQNACCLEHTFLTRNTTTFDWRFAGFRLDRL